jgi:transcriptional regulator with XRE-family HTH domain
MSTRVSDYLAQLPRDEQEEIAALTAVLIKKEATLRKLRDARNRSQEQIAKRLGIQQAAVSKLERRTDMYISTLRNLIQAMGGDLDIIARFPDQPPVRITQFNELAKP